MMNADIKAKFIQALRSGKYNQITGTLRRGDCFCALGVLCDVIDPDAWGAPNSVGTRAYTKDGCYSRTTIPGPILESIGCDIRKEDVAETIMSLNDFHQLPFTEIAYLLENYDEAGIQEQINRDFTFREVQADDRTHAQR